jgi:hypothetical protein
VIAEPAAVAEDGIVALQNRVLPTGEIVADDSRGRRLVMAAKGDFPVPPPPGHMRIERGSYDPRVRWRVLAHLVPGHPRLGERLGHQVLGELPVTHVDQDDPQAVIPGSSVELGEVAPVLLHTPRRISAPIPYPGQGLQLVRSDGSRACSHDRILIREAPPSVSPA